MPKFICSVCGDSFNVPQAALDKYPGWQPNYCRDHSPRKKEKEDAAENPYKKKKGSKSSGTLEKDYTTQEVLDKFSEGPQDGIFTDGSSRPNPGPGGWGAVKVKDGKVEKQEYGKDSDTTNNRMELTALINALQMLEDNEELTIYTDSEFCVNILTKWAPAWERNGWKRKTGPIKNLDLVKGLYELYQKKSAKVEWIEAHNGWLWNEYADSLATAWVREEL